MQRSELGLILELGLPNYSYGSSHLCCRLTHATRAAGELQSSHRRQSRSIGGVRLLHPKGSSTSHPAVTKVDGLPPAP
eukprot:2267181-Pyramimonas_sp.AAC.1